jgi:hypothetical protein
LFPLKPELNSQEEIGLANLLRAFEAVGKPKQVNGPTGAFTSYVIESAVQVEIVDERDFTLLTQLINASRPNGLWIRNKLALKAKLEKVKNA